MKINPYIGKHNQVKFWSHIQIDISLTFPHYIEVKYFSKWSILSKAAAGFNMFNFNSDNLTYTFPLKAVDTIGNYYLKKIISIKPYFV